MDSGRPSSGGARSGGMAFTVTAGNAAGAKVSATDGPKAPQPFLRRNTGREKRIADTKVKRYVPRGGFLTDPHEVDAMIPLGGRPAKSHAGGGRAGPRDMAVPRARRAAAALSGAAPAAARQRTSAPPAAQLTAIHAELGNGVSQRAPDNTNRAHKSAPRSTVASEKRPAARQLQYGPSDFEAELLSAGLGSGHVEESIDALRQSNALDKSSLHGNDEMAEGADAADENRPAAVLPAALADGRWSGIRDSGAACRLAGLSNPAVVRSDSTHAWPSSSGDAGCNGGQGVKSILPPATGEHLGRHLEEQQAGSGGYSPKAAVAHPNLHIRPLASAVANLEGWPAEGEQHIGAVEASESGSEPTPAHWLPGVGQDESGLWEQRPAVHPDRSAQAAQPVVAAPKLAPWGSRAAAAPIRHTDHISSTSSVLQEAGGQPVEGEASRLKVERLRITRMRAQLETALARLKHEKAAFDTHKVEQTAKWEAARDEEARRLKRERRTLDQQMRALIKLPTRKDRSEVEALEAVLEAERRSAREKEARHKLEAERLRRQVKDLQAKDMELQQELRWHEAQRLKEWERAEASQPLGPPPSTSPATASRARPAAKQPRKVDVSSMAPGSRPRAEMDQPSGSCGAAESIEETIGAEDKHPEPGPLALRLQAASYAEQHASCDVSDHPSPPSELGTAGDSAPDLGFELLPDPGLTKGFGSGLTARCGNPFAACGLPAAATGAPFSWNDFNEPRLSPGGAGEMLQQRGSASPSGPGMAIDAHRLPAADNWSEFTEHDISALTRDPHPPGVLSPLSAIPTQGAHLVMKDAHHRPALAALQTRFAEEATRKSKALEACISPWQSPTRPAVAKSSNRWGGSPTAAQGSCLDFRKHTSDTSDSRFFWRGLESGYAADPTGITDCSMGATALPSRGEGSSNRSFHSERPPAVCNAADGPFAAEQRQHMHSQSTGGVVGVEGSVSLQAAAPGAVHFPNGTVREEAPDGTTTVRFTNGDIKRTFPNGRVEYFYRELGTWHTTHGSGIEVFHFGNGQREAHHPHPDSYKEVLYVDGSARVVEEDGRELEMLATQLSAAVRAPCPKI